MSWYRTGTVTVANNSNVITGAGTSWIESAKEGDIFQGPDMISYEITQIVSATSLRISPAYRGAAAAGQNYALIPTRSRDAETSAGISTLVQSYQDVRNNAGTGKFATGTAGAPSLRGLADQDTGINFAENNILQLIAGGIVKASVNADGFVDGNGKKYLTSDIAVKSIATGGIMEQGRNANGDYIRLASGLLICWRYVVGYPVGESYYNFPAAFIEKPVCFASATPSGRPDGYYAENEVMGISMPTASSVGVLHILAIGRWKND